MFTITRDGTTVKATELPSDMPETARRRLAVLGVVFYDGGAVKVTDESPKFWLASAEEVSA